MEEQALGRRHDVESLRAMPFVVRGRGSWASAVSLLPTQSTNLSAVGEWILVPSYECPVILLATTGTSTSRPPAGRESNWNGMLRYAEYGSRKRALGIIVGILAGDLKTMRSCSTIAPARSPTRWSRLLCNTLR